ncbi:MAG: hypothetical protein JW729_02905, partial [Bacteroidales bacterium]|nr:hypothetical protein [Bacteroidales bacterium]
EELKQACAKSFAEQKIIEEYESLLTKAEELASAEDYLAAIELFKKASNLFPDNPLPKERIKAINNLLNAQAAYADLIKTGDANYASGKFNDALFSYYKAKNLKPKESYPQDRIDEIDKILIAQKAEDELFQNQLSKADSLFDSKHWGESISVYESLLAQKSSNKHIQDRIENARKYFLAEKVLNEKYSKAISEADEYFDKQSFAEAKKAYLLANQLKPNDPYPLYKIEDINTITEQQDIRTTNNRYREVIDQADKNFNQQALSQALTLYQQATTIKPNESYPKDQIAKINLILAQKEQLENQYKKAIQSADSAFYLESYAYARLRYVKANQLKAEEAYPPAQIQKIDALLNDLNTQEANYNAAILRADASFKHSKYNPAKVDYQLALNIKPLEEYPANKIKEIDNILANLSAKEAKEVAYQKAIQSADSAYFLELYAFARLHYVKAKHLKAEEIYPPAQIQKIDAHLASLNAKEAAYQKAIQSADSAFSIESYAFARLDYVKANQLKAEETYPPAQIQKIDALLNALNTQEANYNAAILRADASFERNEYGSAKADYQLALSIKPKEAYPANRIKEIENILANLSAREAAYQKAIQEGDQDFSAKRFSLAIKNFNEAIRIKENESYPKERIKAIEDYLAEMEKMNLAYADLIRRADGKYQNQNYQEAIVIYQESMQLKPNEKYPPDQIARINGILANQKNLEESYKTAIAKADQLFNATEYQQSLTFYQQANQLKPIEKYPLQQMERIRTLLGSSRKEYEAYILKGDDAYQKSIFQDAILAYESALGIFPDEAYPRSMLDKIEAKIRRESVVSLVSIPEVITAGMEKKYTFAPIDYRDRQNNYILIEMKNNTAKQMRVFISFGKNGSKNGGYSVNLIQRDGYTKYFVSIDRQLRWISEDNNWLSLLPEGGDLEVNIIQISREEKK